MIKKTKIKFKSNKGFTMQDLVIAMWILTLFVGIIGSVYVATYKIQAETKIDEIATIHVIEIIEYIDKISYDDVQNGMENDLVSQFNIPSKFNVSVNVSEYKPSEDASDLVKEVSVNIDFTFSNNQRNILMKRLKVKEV